jgi:arylsulfatase A-like enzyme
MGVDPGSVDGVNLVPLLEGQERVDRGAIYFHYPHYHHMDPAGAIRSGDWKLIEHFDDGELELYDLRSDVGETTNLAERDPRKASELHEKLAAWRASVGAQIPRENPNYNPARAGMWRPR